jgi:AcrR family transcriptional regulator
MVKNLQTRATRSDGVESRETILNAAARLATIEGLEGMSIGRLAEHIGMSKSGLYAHFGSKEELQLATVETAARIFDAEVIKPTEAIDDPVERLLALRETFISHLERSVFPGGCFFISAINEFDTRPGPVRDRLNQFGETWLGMFKALVREGQARGSIREDEDPDQLSWELDAFLLMGNMSWLTDRLPASLNRSRIAFARRLERARTKAS